MLGSEPFDPEEIRNQFANDAITLMLDQQPMGKLAVNRWLMRNRVQRHMHYWTNFHDFLRRAWNLAYLKESRKLEKEHAKASAVRPGRAEAEAGFRTIQYYRMLKETRVMKITRWINSEHGMSDAQCTFIAGRPLDTLAAFLMTDSLDSPCIWRLVKKDGELDRMMNSYAQLFDLEDAGWNFIRETSDSLESWAPRASQLTLLAWAGGWRRFMLRFRGNRKDSAAFPWGLLDLSPKSGISKQGRLQMMRFFLVASDCCLSDGCQELQDDWLNFVLDEFGVSRDSFDSLSDEQIDDMIEFLVDSSKVQNVADELHSVLITTKQVEEAHATHNRHITHSRSRPTSLKSFVTGDVLQSHQSRHVALQRAKRKREADQEPEEQPPRVLKIARTGYSFYRSDAVAKLHLARDLGTVDKLSIGNAHGKGDALDKVLRAKWAAEPMVVRSNFQFKANIEKQKLASKRQELAQRGEQIPKRNYAPAVSRQQRLIKQFDDGLGQLPLNIDEYDECVKGRGMRTFATQEIWEAVLLVR